MLKTAERARTAPRTSHKDAAIAFLRMTSSGRVRQAYEQYVGQHFKHHNPHYPGDAESLATGMEEMALKHPDLEFHVERALEDGDLVAVHSRVRLHPKEREFVTTHIFRFAGDRIVEFWDLAMEQPTNSPNENGLF